MAKYSADITKNANVATADPSGGIRAAQQSAQMLETMFGGIKQGVQMYGEKVMADTQVEMKAAQSQFYNEAFEQPRLLQDMAADASKANAALNMGADTPVDTPEYTATMAGIKQQMDKWKAGVEQGHLGLSAYQNRIQMLAQKSIAAAPWLGMEIRKTLMEGTGLPYIDRETTAAYFTRQMMQGMGKEEKKGEDWQKKKDFELIAGNNAIGYEQLEHMYQNDPQEYARQRSAALDKVAVAQSRANLEHAKAATEGMMWRDVNKATGLLIAEAGVGVQEGVVNIMKRHSGLMKNLAGVGVGTDLAQTPGLTAQLGIVQGELAASIKNNVAAAKQALLDRRGLMSKGDFDAQMERITGQEKLWLESATPQNIGTTLQILSAHREKSLDERLKMVQAYSGFISAYGETELIKAVVSGNEDMKAQIERVRPGLVKRTEAAFTGSMDSLVAAGQLTSNIGQALADASASPEASPVKPGQDREQVRDGNAVVDAEAVQRARQWAATPAAGLSETTANVFGTMLNNNSKGMADGVMLRERRTELASAYQALPQELKPRVDASVSQQQVTSLQEIINEMGDKLKLGTMPDGRVVVMPPMELLEEGPGARRSPGIKGGMPLYGSPAEKLESTKVARYFASKYKPYENLVVKKGKEEEYARYEAAAEAFENQRGNQLRNMAVVRSIVTNGDPAKVATDIALQLNTKKVVPFAQYAPQEVPEPEKKTGGKGFYAGTVQGVSTKPQSGDTDKVAVLTQELESERKVLEAATDPAAMSRSKAYISQIETELEKAKKK